MESVQNAREVRTPPSEIELISMEGFFIMLVTSTIPVSAHTTTVSQKVPVLDTSAWRTGFLV